MTKYCKRCDQILNIDKFTKSKNRYDGVQSYCSECMKKYRIEHYQANKPAHYARNNKARAISREYILNLKNTTPCADCEVIYIGEPWLTEFDHLPEFKKISGIAKLSNTNGLHKKLKEELKKCELVCVVCHRRRTAKRAGWVDNRLAYLLE